MKSVLGELTSVALRPASEILEGPKLFFRDLMPRPKAGDSRDALARSARRVQARVRGAAARRRTATGAATALRFLRRGAGRLARRARRAAAAAALRHLARLSWRSRCRAVGAPSVAAALVLLTFFPRLLLAGVLGAGYWVWCRAPALLGRLAAFGMTKTPNSFDWAIGWIAVSLAPPASGRPSRVTVGDWTWRNPAGFPAGGYVLRVERLEIEFDLVSVWRAIFDRHGHAIEISELHIKGCHFTAARNTQDALNLMVALNLPDQDENVIARTLARRFDAAGADAADARGSRRAAWGGRARAPSLLAPASSPRRTTVGGAAARGCGRAAALVAAPFRAAFACCRTVASVARGRQLDWDFADEPAATVANPLTGSFRRRPRPQEDTPLWSPRRRPRWGVRWRFPAWNPNRFKIPST